jgi:hypothetical protein
MADRGFFVHPETGEPVRYELAELDKNAPLPDTLFGKPVLVDGRKPSEVVGKNARCTRRLRKKYNKKG